MMTLLSQSALAISGLLFASLWQGVLIAGLVFVGLRALPKIGAATRYAVWLCALVALVVIPVVASTLSSMRVPTPVRETTTVEVRNVAGANLPALPPIDSVVPVTQTPVSVERITIPQTLGVVAALIWMLLAGARGLMLAFNVREISSIRRDARLWSDAGDYPVLLSDRVTVPIAIGFTHPAIVLPASIVDEQSSDAVDAIIMHETAHLRRNDVYTNAFARVLEALLAFNPIAWFVLRKLSVEREIACDDWVVNQFGNGDVFARALASMASCAGARTPIAAPSALGSRHAVVARIEQLLEKHPRRLRLSLSALGGTLMLLAIIAIVLQSISPVLAYAPQSPATIVAAGGCATPNRVVQRQNYLDSSTGRKIFYEPLPTPAQLANWPTGRPRVVMVDVTVDASGVARNVVVSGPSNAASARVKGEFMSSKYEPAISNCVAVASTTRTWSVVAYGEAGVYSVVAPSYPEGWSDQHASACKVPNLLHGGVPTMPATFQIPDGANATASVRVHVDAQGAVTSATLARSSGYRAFDSAVLAAARAATYPLKDSTGFRAVRPSGQSLTWNATHGYNTFSKCSPLPTDYVWSATYHATGASVYAN